MLIALPALAAVACLVLGLVELSRYRELDTAYVPLFSRQDLPVAGLTASTRGTTTTGNLQLEYDGAVLRVRRAHGLARRLPVFGWATLPEGAVATSATLRWGARSVSPLVFFLDVLPAFGVGVTQTVAVADELFQETWVRVARRIPTFDPARPFSKWMLSIAINLSIDHARRTTVRRGEQLSTPAHVEAAPGRATLADHELMAEEERLQVAAALQKLPEAMRTAVLMRYFEDQSEQAMATVLEVPAGTVKSRLHHALKKLRAQLERTS